MLQFSGHVGLPLECFGSPHCFGPVAVYGVGWRPGVADPPLNQQSTCLARCARSDYGLVTAGRVIAGLSDSHQGVSGSETLMGYSWGCLLKHNLHL